MQDFEIHDLDGTAEQRRDFRGRTRVCQKMLDWASPALLNDFLGGSMIIRSEVVEGFRNGYCKVLSMVTCLAEYGPY